MNEKKQIYQPLMLDVVSVQIESGYAASEGVFTPDYEDGGIL